MLKVNAGTPQEISITYDGDGQRVSKTVAGVTTKFLVDTNNLTGYAQVVEELSVVSSQLSVIRQYTYGHDLISQRQFISGAWQTSWYQYDGHGSVRSLTNSAGSVTDTFTYDAFGGLIARTGTAPNLYLYAGEQYDPDLVLYYNRARYLKAETGRFWTQDSYEGCNCTPSTQHKYGYTSNNPVNKVDPSGYFTIAEAAASNSIRNTLSAIAILSLASICAVQYQMSVSGIDSGRIDSPCSVKKKSTNIVKFVHGTNSANAVQINTIGLVAGIGTYDALFTFPLQPNPVVAIETALSFAVMHGSRPATAMIGQLPEPLFDEMVKTGSILIGGFGRFKEWVFLPQSWVTVDAYNKGKWELITPAQ